MDASYPASERVWTAWAPRTQPPGVCGRRGRVKSHAQPYLDGAVASNRTPAVVCGPRRRAASSRRPSLDRVVVASARADGRIRTASSRQIARPQSCLDCADVSLGTRAIGPRSPFGSRRALCESVSPRVLHSSPSSVVVSAVGPCTALHTVGRGLSGRSVSYARSSSAILDFDPCSVPFAIGCVLRFLSVSYARSSVVFLRSVCVVRSVVGCVLGVRSVPAPPRRRVRSSRSVPVRSSSSSGVFFAVCRCSVLPIVGCVLGGRSVPAPPRRRSRSSRSVAVRPPRYRVRSSISVRVLPSPSSAAFSVVCRCSVLPIVGCVLGGRSVPAPPRRRPRSSRSVAARPPRYRVRSQWSVAARPPRYRVRSQWSVAVRSSPSSAAFSVVGRCTAPSLSGAFSVVSRCSVLPIVGRVLSGRSLHGPTAVCGLPTLHWSRVHTRGWLSGWTPSVAARTHRWSSHVSEQSVRPSRYRLPWPPPGADAAVQPAPVCCHRI